MEVGVAAEVPEAEPEAEVVPVAVEGDDETVLSAMGWSDDKVERAPVVRAGSVPVDVGEGIVEEPVHG